MRRAPQVVVIGDSAAPPALLRTAEALGTRIARLGCTLITGGRGGIMEAASRGARRAGGVVIGIVPGSGFAEGNRWCSVVLPTGLGHARNALTALAGDVVVAVGGGAGTLSELAFAWMHGRPILVLQGTGGWADGLPGDGLDARRSSTITACADLDACEQALRALLFPRRRRRPRGAVPAI